MRETQVEPITSSAANTVSRVGPGVGKLQKRNSPPYWMMFPALLLLIIIVVAPFLVAVYTSFTKLDQYTIANWTHAPFVGWKNYVNAFTQGNALGASAIQSVWVSIAFSLLTTIGITPIGIIAALLVNKPFRGQRWVRAMFLIPYVMPIFVNAITWRLLFMNGWGLIDRILSALHLASKNTFWLIGPHSFWAMVIADIWSSWPFVYLMVLAGLQGISDDLYESAHMDGATPIRCFFSITLPSLRPILGLALLLSTLNHFNNFTLPFIMFGTPPAPQADVLPLNVYVTSFQTFNFGLGAAMSLLTLVLMMIPAFFYIRMLRLGEES
ncbi:sugar ABC transporter permease [Fodinisporobacter ferrooxydans]|uniref:Sugar ABC transporter permease n=1 Tax=Fodinisporobacter ferrooxydans TaxID=2901836 RepID=A0ABY4CJS4_9BACL|nr:sugar ABC transporter permease [Alicyclobacillaceae bacterium MYW30-H2]